MDLHLRGKTALITGGSRGIGFAIANEFAAEGCNIILVSKSAENLAAAKREIDAKHRVSVTCVAADLGTPGEPARVGAIGRDIDILVNNAGAIPQGSIEGSLRGRVAMARVGRAYAVRAHGYITGSRGHDGVSRFGPGVLHEWDDRDHRRRVERLARRIQRGIR